jgi:glycosyltransferase involved in cell wall biosynthesis
MIVVSVHNFYRQPGGEDEVFRQEARLLERNGHQVVRYEAHNDDIPNRNSIALLADTVFNQRAYHRVRALLRDSKPDIVHVHNTFPIVSPAVYYAARAEGIPVVQTLHNYRFLCPSAVLYREKNVCEKCIHAHSPWPAIQHACYRQSRPASAAAAAMLTAHRIMGTFGKHVTTYIALSEFARAKFIQGGFPAGNIVVKPNFIEPDPGCGPGLGSYCIFVGRLVPEKGIHAMLDAWTRFSPPLDLEIAGDGDLANEVAAAAERCPRIKWLGRLPKDQLYERMKNAAALIVPSLWYEPFGLVVVEAFAMGLPVIASKIGALAALVDHGRTGFHFEPQNAEELAARVTELHANSQVSRRMRLEARGEFESHYTGKRNYALLMEIYLRTIGKYRSVQTSSAIAPQAEEVKSLLQTAGKSS